MHILDLRGLGSSGRFLASVETNRDAPIGVSGLASLAGLMWRRAAVRRGEIKSSHKGPCWVSSEVVADRESVKEITTKKTIDICYQYINTVNLYKSKAMTMTKKAIIRRRMLDCEFIERLTSPLALRSLLET